MRKLLIFILCTILLVGTVSALFPDKSFNKELGQKYGTITITNWFGLGEKLAEYTLLDNSDQCLINCYASGTVTLYSSGGLLNSVKLLNIAGKEMESQKISILIKKEIISTIDIPKYENVCAEVLNKNSSNIENLCEIKQTGTEKKTTTKVDYVDYDGKELPIGTYEWKIEGKKNINSKVDWIATTSVGGKETTEWSWWSGSWTKRKEVNITRVPETLANKTVYVNVTFDADMQTDFDDIRFVDGACYGTQDVELTYELDRKIDSNSAGFWVKIPSLTSGNGDKYQICMYYKNAAASSTSNPKNTWDSYYKGVYHLTGNYVDSSGFSNGTATGTPSSATDCSFGTCYNFQADAMIALSESWDDGGLTALTIESFAKHEDPAITYSFIVGKDSGSGNRTFNFGKTASAQSLYGEFYMSAGTKLINGLGEMGINKTNFIAAVVDYNTTAYINTTRLAGVAASSTLLDTTSLLTIGAVVQAADDQSVSQGWKGNIDEVRLSTTNRSIQWLNRSYLDKTSPAIFSAEEDAADDVSVFLISPAEGETVGSSIVLFNATFDAGSLNLTNATLYVWSLNQSVFKTNYTLLSKQNDYNISSSASGILTGTYYYNYYACANKTGSSDCSWSASNKSFIRSITVGSNTYNATTYETSRESFILEITPIEGDSINVAYLIYNTSSYVGSISGSGSNTKLSRTIDIPIGAGTQNFYWRMIYASGSEANTTNYKQNVTTINMSSCAGAFNVSILNFTAYVESNLTRLQPFDFAGTFNYWLGSGTTYKNISLSRANTNETVICISPADKKYKIDANIEYGKTGFVTRNYYYQNKQVSNATENVSLYLLENDEATTFIIKVQDINYFPLANLLVNIQRYYPSTGTYETVQVAKTDDNGKTLGFYKTETVEYRHIITNQSTILLTTNKQKVFGETVPYTLTFTIGEGVTKPWADAENLTDLEYSLTFNSTTKMVSYYYADSSPDFQKARLWVEMDKSTTTQTKICDTNSTYSVNTITCNLSSYTENSFIARSYITRAGYTERLIYTLTITINDVIDTFGQAGLFLAWFIILTSAMIFLWSPIAGIWSVTISVIFVNIIGLASFGLVYIFGMIALAIILSVLIKN